MKPILTFLLLFAIRIINVQAQEEKNFIPLFDGSDLNAWNHTEGDGFRIEDGILITDSFREGKDLYTKEKYGNFILRFEFMLSDVGNSGVFIRTDPENRSGTGFEVQLLAPWTPWRDDLHCTASLYGHVAVTNRPDETTGKWYQMEIICDRKNIAVSVNGMICTIANMHEIKSLQDRNISGVIGLQVNHAEKEGQWTKFRNIRIRNLDKEPEYVARGLGILDPVIREQAHDAALKMDSEIIGSLAFHMAGEDPVSSSGAKQALFDITAHISAPDIDKAKKSELAGKLQETANNSQSEIVKNYLIWLQGMLR